MDESDLRRLAESGYDPHVDGPFFGNAISMSYVDLLRRVMGLRRGQELVKELAKLVLAQRAIETAIER